MKFKFNFNITPFAAAVHKKSIEILKLLLTIDNIKVNMKLI